MTIGEAIHKRRKELGLTLEEVGKYVGVSKSTVRKWETGFISNMKRDKISLLAKVLKINPASLIIDPNEEVKSFENDTIFEYDNIYPISKQKIPLLGEIACGKPIYADEHIECYIEVGTNVQADFCLKAKGDSMIGARILDGDIVFIRKQDMVENGEIAAVIIEDEATLKRVYYNKKNNLLKLVAENPNISTMVYSGEELNQIHILGKAIAFQSDVK